jgi:class 3 adenylate cyclase
MIEASVRGRSGTVTWRRLLLALVLVAALLQGVNAWMNAAILGTIGIDLRPAQPYPVPGVETGTPFVEKVSVHPDSPASRAGLRTGDLIDARQLSEPERLRWFNVFWIAGERVELPVVRSNQTRSISVVTETVPMTWDVWLSYVAAFWELLFAGLIAWRRAESYEARTLALLLVLNNLGWSFTPNYWITPWPAIDATLQAFVKLLLYANFALLATYAMLFARPPSRIRRTLAWLSYATAGIAVAYGFAYVAGVWTMSADPARAWYSALPTQIVTGTLPYLFPILCAIVTAAQTRGAERARIVWVTLSLAPYYFVSAISTFEAIDPDNSAFTFFTYAQYVSIPLFVAPLGLTYALLSRRLLGVGFALNRAVVFSALAVVVMGVFVVAEWLLDLWFGSAGRIANVAVRAAVALGLGLSLRYLYTYINAFVDTVLFRKQSEARALVGRMIAGLPYAESASAVGDVLVNGVCAGLHVASATLFRRGVDGRFRCTARYGWADGEEIAEADVEKLSVTLEGGAALLRLTDFPFTPATRVPVGHPAPTLGVPLYVRRQLAGFALYSGHTNGTALDPDERAMFVTLGTAASQGYDALELADRVETSYLARVEAEREAKETLRRSNAALERLNESYVRYVPAEFLALLNKRTIVDVHLGDHVDRTMTVFFSDIRSFTTMSESMTREQIFAFLNDYLKRAGPLIRENGGFIDKYIGDAVMGLFPETPDDAVRAAIALQREVRLFNRRNEGEGLPQIAIGVGIHHGPLMLGTIGERDRMNTTVIADAVNIAARLETATKLYRCSILLSRQTLDALREPDRFMLRPLGSVYVKGKAQSVEIYECYDADAADLAMHKRATSARFIEAVTAFAAGDPGAYDAFAEIATTNARDGAAAYFLERCSERTATTTHRS